MVTHQYVLGKLNIFILSSRRTNDNLVFLSKFISGEVDAPDLLAKVNFKVPTYVIFLNSMSRGVRQTINITNPFCE